MKTTIKFSRKSNGTFFIGTPENPKQELVFETDSAEQIVEFFKPITPLRIIKKTYSQSQAYFNGGEIFSVDFWNKFISKKEKENYEARVKNVAEKVRRKTAAFLSIERENQTKAAFTEEVKNKFIAKWAEISNNQKGISNKQANRLAWKKQNYLGIERVDICELRSLLKAAINK